MTTETPENEQNNPEEEQAQPEAAEETAPEASAEPPADEPAPETPAEPSADSADDAADEPVPAVPSAEGGEETAGEDGEDGPELDIGSEAGPDSEVDPNYQPVIRGKIDKFGVAMGTGRRKTSVARVRVKSGEGKLTINGRELDDYVHLERDRQMIQAPLKATETLGKVDVWVKVNGGGTTGQTGAVVLGIARALQAMNPSLHGSLSEGGFLTRDGRMVERKKYGYKKARKSFQFSKR